MKRICEKEQEATSAVLLVVMNDQRLQNYARTVQVAIPKSLHMTILRMVVGWYKYARSSLSRCSILGRTSQFWSLDMCA